MFGLLATRCVRHNLAADVRAFEGGKRKLVDGGGQKWRGWLLMWKGHGAAVFVVK